MSRHRRIKLVDPVNFQEHLILPYFGVRSLVILRVVHSESRKLNIFPCTDGMTENQNPICFVRGSFFSGIIKNTYCCGKLTLWPYNPTTTIQNPLRWNMFYLWHTKSNNWAIQSDLNSKTLSVWVSWQRTTFDSNFTPISRHWYRTFLSIQLDAHIEFYLKEGETLIQNFTFGRSKRWRQFYWR